MQAREKRSGEQRPGHEESATRRLPPRTLTAASPIAAGHCIVAIHFGIPNETHDREGYISMGLAIKAALRDHPEEAFGLIWESSSRWTAGEKRAPAASHVMAARELVRFSGVSADTDGAERPLHELTQAELIAAANKARAALEELDAEVIKGEVPAGGVFD